MQLAEVWQVDVPVRRTTPEVSDTMRRVLSSVLINRGIDAAILADPDPRRVMHALSRWLTSHNRWSSGARFTAGTGSEDYDLIGIVMAAALVDKFRGKADAMLEFAIRMCTIREKAEREALGGDALLSLTQHVWPSALESPIRFVSRLAAWDLGPVRPAGSKKNSGVRLSGFSVPAGTIEDRNGAFRKLYGTGYAANSKYPAMDRSRFAEIMGGEDEAAKASLVAKLPLPMRTFHSRMGRQHSASYRVKGDPFYHVLANSLPTLRSGLKSGASAVLMLGASRIASGRQKDLGVFSVLRLIGAVAELAALKSEALSDEQIAARISNLLNEAELFRSFPAPGHAAFPSGATEPSEDDDSSEDAASGPPLHGETSREGWREAFVEMVILWVRQNADGRPVMSPQTLSRIWTRFTYAFDSIRDSLSESRTYYLGALVHRTIIAFLHAVGIEALRTTSHSMDSLTYSNPVASSRPFYRLLEVIYGHDGSLQLDSPELAFFDEIFTCPIWGYFLAREDSELSEASGIDYSDRVITKYFRRIASRRSETVRVANGTSGVPPINNLSFSVHYGHPGAPKGSAHFTGFFALLNTIPINGTVTPQAVRNFQLAEFFEETTTAVSRRPRRSASTKTSPE